MFRDLVLKNRSIRRFEEATPVSMESLKALIDLARLTPSGANLQPLKYVLSVSPECNAQIYPTLAWAGYLRDWDGPAPGERPGAYVVMLCDKTIAANPGCDHGIAAQTICLGAAEQGIGACMIGSIQRKKLAEILDIDTERYDIHLVIALGYPAETIKLEGASEAGDIKYYRDDVDVHHVPKRALEDVILDCRD